MKVRELTADLVEPGVTRIRVTRVAPSEAERLGYVDDAERLTGATGTLRCLGPGPLPQLGVDWDDDGGPGSLMLAPDDEIEIL
jgi:hypothetical protein